MRMRKNKGGGVRSRVQKPKAAKAARKTRKQNAQLKRKDNRVTRKEKRISARDQRKTARISARNAKKLGKIYGELSPEEVNQLNEIQPLVGAMSEELSQKGIPIQDEEDTIEIAAKYAQANDDIEDPLDEDEFEEAFVLEEESFESVDKYNNRRAVVKSVLTGIVGGVNEFAKQAAEKEKYDQPLTKSERAILDAKKDAIDAGKGEFFKDNMGKIVALLALAIIAAVLFKKS